MRWLPDAASYAIGDSLTWLTDLRTGKPVVEQPIRFYLEAEQVAESTTDRDGVGLAQLPLTPENNYWPVRALAGEPGDPDFAAVSSEWNSGVAVWDFGLNGGYSAGPRDRRATPLG